MKYDEEKSEYVFDNGKSIYCFGGIAIDANKNIIFGHCDDYIDAVIETLTPEERKEIAEYMVNLWNEWAK